MPVRSLSDNGPNPFLCARGSKILTITWLGVGTFKSSLLVPAKSFAHNLAFTCWVFCVVCCCCVVVLCVMCCALLCVVVCCRVLSSFLTIVNEANRSCQHTATVSLCRSPRRRRTLHRQGLRKLTLNSRTTGGAQKNAEKPRKNPSPTKCP